MTALEICIILLAALALGQCTPAVILKHTSSTVEYGKVELNPETSIVLEFYGDVLQGRLLYAENTTMGTFISLKLVRPGSLRFEMKLTSHN